MKRMNIITHRNMYGFKGTKSIKNVVNLEAYPLNNIGDTLGPIISLWMLERKGVVYNKILSKTKHLLSVGSVVSLGLFDATVWGSGIRDSTAAGIIKKKKLLLNRKFDVRAVRGPLTQQILSDCGYACPSVFGDPAILLPFIYEPNGIKQEYDVGIVLHHRTIENENTSAYLNEKDKDLLKNKTVKYIDPRTSNYAQFVDQIVSAQLIISSSLHGLIIAEAYGIPAIFLNSGVDDQNTKYKDWYLSTGREFTFCHSISEGVTNGKLPRIPNLNEMQRKLINSFPYDLWEE